MKKSINISIEKLFLIIAIPLGILYAFFILPLNVPDEGSHVMRAYDISVGNFLTKVDEKGNSSSTIITELEFFSYVRFLDYASIKKEISKPTDYNDTTEIVCAAQSYSPLLYIGSASAFFIGRVLHMNVFIAFYLGRLFNLMIFIILGYYAIKKIPFGKLVLAICLCMPMILQQAASNSADSILNSVLIYYIAFLIYLVFKETEITKKEVIQLCILTALVAMFKYIYVLVAGILFIKAFKNKEERKSIIKIISIMILVGAIFSFGWLIISSKAKSVSPVFENYNEVMNVDSAKQIDFMKNNVASSGKIVLKEYFTFGMEYILEAIGSKLGWLDVKITSAITIPYLLLMVYACVTEDSKYEFSNKQKIWLLLIVFAISLLLMLIMYVSFTTVGAEKIAGVQGRYFSSVFIIPLLCLIKKENFLKIEKKNEKLMTMAFLLNVLTLIEVLVYYI